MNASHDERLVRAHLSLAGLSVGDAFGKAMMADPALALARQDPPEPPWRWTDDTAMAISIVEALAAGSLDATDLASRFARRFRDEPDRGYGAVAYYILHSIAAGSSWEVVSRSVFSGTGSMGNGAAMRASPIGAFYADNLVAVRDAAETSSLPTHAHPDGRAGAVAVAVAAATAWAIGARRSQLARDEFVREVLTHMPAGPTRDGLQRVASFDLDADPGVVATAVGSGERLLSSDTVPFCIWAAARHLDDYEEAIWTTARVATDLDTMCAIVGGIVVMSTGESSIPPRWLAAREPLPPSAPDEPAEQPDL
jgi:ADP-ribosylglycohydrolase